MRTGNRVLPLSNGATIELDKNTRRMTNYQRPERQMRTSQSILGLPERENTRTHRETCEIVRQMHQKRIQESETLKSIGQSKPHHNSMSFEQRKHHLDELTRRQAYYTMEYKAQEKRSNPEGAASKQNAFAASKQNALSTRNFTCAIPQAGARCEQRQAGRTRLSPKHAAQQLKRY